MLVRDRGLVLQLPHHHVDEVGILDDNGHLLEHVLEANVGLFQAGDTERGGAGGGRGKVNAHGGDADVFTVE